MAESFIPNSENKPQINHKDGNKQNNHVDNLEWCTCLENIHHAKNNNLTNYLAGEEHGCSKLSNDQVVTIRKELKTKSATFIANKYSVSVSVVSGVKQNRRYSNIELTSPDIKNISSFYNKLSVYNLDNEFIEEFNTQKEFCLKYGKRESSLSRAFNGGLKIEIWGFILERIVN